MYIDPELPRVPSLSGVKNPNKFEGSSMPNMYLAQALLPSKESYNFYCVLLCELKVW